MTGDSAPQKHGPSERRGAQEPSLPGTGCAGFGAHTQDGVSPSLGLGVWGRRAQCHGSGARAAREPFGSRSGFEDGDASTAASCHGDSGRSATRRVVSCHVSSGCILLPTLLLPLSAGGSRVLRLRAHPALAPPPDTPGAGWSRQPDRPAVGKGVQCQGMHSVSVVPACSPPPRKSPNPPPLPFARLDTCSGARGTTVAWSVR